MDLTIFYAWQNDRPAKINRNFIEAALKSAARKSKTQLGLELAARPPEFSVDKDTAKVPGTPPIAETIFQKIDRCAIFVADLTFIGQSELGRQLCNPNVLIEYGYARDHTLGTNCLVPVMNTAFGEPGEYNEKLPFDMRHLRSPICYKLHEDADTEQRARVKSELTKQLNQAILEIVGSGLINELIPTPKPFPEVAHTDWRSTFYDPGEAIVQVKDDWDTRRRALTVPAGPKLYLRLIPNGIEEELSSVDAVELLRIGQLLPMRSSNYTGGVSWHRNKYGAIAYTADERRITALTQLHKNREIWGIDTTLGRMNRILRYGFEEVFVSNLAHYLSFAQNRLSLSFPVTVEAGITKVEGFQIEAPPGMEFGLSQFGGQFIEAEVFKRFSVESSEANSEEILLPFFEYVWREAGVKNRPVSPVSNG